MSSEEYERVRREIGWHTSWEDVAFWVVLFILIGMMVGLA